MLSLSWHGGKKQKWIDPPPPSQANSYCASVSRLDLFLFSFKKKIKRKKSVTADKFTGNSIFPGLYCYHTCIALCHVVKHESSLLLRVKWENVKLWGRKLTFCIRMGGRLHINIPRNGLQWSSVYTFVPEPEDAKSCHDLHRIDDL